MSLDDRVGNATPDPGQWMVPYVRSAMQYFGLGAVSLAATAYAGASSLGVTDPVFLQSMNSIEQLGWLIGLPSLATAISELAIANFKAWKLVRNDLRRDYTK